MIGANRRKDWPERLTDLVIKSSNRPFQWGAFDCSQFCIQAELEICGETRWEDFIGGYKTERGANGRIKKAKADSLWNLIDQRMERLASVKLAQRGDWIGHYTDDGESLGILIGDRFACVGKPAGIVLKPLDEAVVAWRL